MEWIHRARNPIQSDDAKKDMLRYKKGMYEQEITVPMEWVRKLGGCAQHTSDERRRPGARRKNSNLVPRQWVEKMEFENDLARIHATLDAINAAEARNKKELEKRWEVQAHRLHIERCLHRIEMNHIRHEFGSNLLGTDKTMEVIIEDKIRTREQFACLYPETDYKKLRRDILEVPMASPARSIPGHSAAGLRCEARAQIQESERLLLLCAEHDRK